MSTGSTRALRARIRQVETIAGLYHTGRITIEQARRLYAQVAR